MSKALPPPVTVRRYAPPSSARRKSDPVVKSSQNREGFVKSLFGAVYSNRFRQAELLVDAGTPVDGRNNETGEKVSPTICSKFKKASTPGVSKC